MRRVLFVHCHAVQQPAALSALFARSTATFSTARLPSAAASSCTSLRRSVSSIPMLSGMLQVQVRCSSTTPTSSDGSVPGKVVEDTPTVSDESTASASAAAPEMASHQQDGGDTSTTSATPPVDDSMSVTSSSTGGPSTSSIFVKEEVPDAVMRVKWMPLTLIEEIPLPTKMLSDMELLMTAWCEEHARQYAIILFGVRVLVFIMMFIIVYVFYRTQISSEKTLRGVDNMPSDLRIGNVVYFDITENGLDIGRVVIGLLTEQCPLYTEYFHRRCTGNGDTGDSFRGLKLAALIPRSAAIFGDGSTMTHDVQGFDNHCLPTECTSRLYRGAISSIATGFNKESPNFAIHLSAGDYEPQIFALVVGGYDVIERMSQGGVRYGCTPKREFVVEACGELCTLDKSHILPLPWKLYHNVSRAMDEEKFGECYPPSMLAATEQLAFAGAAGAGPAHVAPASTRPWWKIW
jgi:hypothetical protein